MDLLTVKQKFKISHSAFVRLYLSGIILTHTHTQTHNGNSITTKKLNLKLLYLPGDSCNGQDNLFNKKVLYLLSIVASDLPLFVTVSCSCYRDNNDQISLTSFIYYINIVSYINWYYIN